MSKRAGRGHHFAPTWCPRGKASGKGSSPRLKRCCDWEEVEAKRNGYPLYTVMITILVSCSALECI